MNRKKAIFCWSGGKDSAYALYKVLNENLFDVKYLLTTINSTFKRISMHGVQEQLLEFQANSIGIDLLKVYVSEGSNTEYEKQMNSLLTKAKAEGISHVIYGDIFLEDLRVYREENMAKIGMECVFPIWKLDTKWLVGDFISKGFKTITCCVSDEYLDENWIGREINSAFVKELPSEVDPCGENGEFHTFCYDGPLFRTKIKFEKGEIVYRPIEFNADSVCSSMSKAKGFWFCDLILSN